ncbi:MAG: methyltransferase domain-containing protein [Alphaproteobacteria bacterium]|nr:methyltransferase domain-containing protein [Alphaproteobacteria bacterium]
MAKISSRTHPNFVSADTKIEWAQRFLADGQAGDADALFSEVLQKDKNSFMALRGRAAVAEYRGQTKRAAKFTQNANEQEIETHCKAAEKASDDALYSKAITLYEQALSVEPENLDAIWGTAECYAALDERVEAASWYQRYLDIEPGEPEALHMLSAMGMTDVPDRASNGYVATLFDRFAPDFDEQLTGELEYQVPAVLAETAKDCFPEANGGLDVLDLGCGTGLSGVAIKDLAKRIDGVDLSGEMLKLARKRRIYKKLTKSDIISYLDDAPRQYDLVLGADVFIYFGSLDALFSGITGALKPGGFVIFSLEAQPEDQQTAGYELTASGRYSHGRNYVRSVAQTSNLLERSVNIEQLRTEYGEPVLGDIWVFQKAD